MKKISIFTIFLSFFFYSTVQSYSSNPKEFVTELINDAITKLSDKSASKEEKSKFIEQIALENVDINALGLYTLGEIRKSAKKDEISRYQIIYASLKGTFFLVTLNLLKIF